MVITRVRTPPRGRCRSCAVVVALGALVTSALSLQASTPRFFVAATQADFLRGDVENLSIDNRGRVALGLASEVVYDTPAPFVWSLLSAPDGTVFIGTGTEGRVYRIDAQGNGSVFFDAQELQVHALALAPDGSLYVGSSPDGRIYRVDRTGRSTTFFEPGERYIWALAVDAAGVVYAATGESGSVYRITPDGEGRRFYQARATHATALAFDPNGNLIVGTAGPGRVLRVDREGAGFMLLDSAFREIRGVRYGPDGMLYVGAVNGSPGGMAAPPPAASPTTPSAAEMPAAPTASVTTEVTVAAVVDASAGGSTSSAPGGGGQGPVGALFRITPTGLWDKLWESREDTPYDFAFDQDRRLIVATGNQGKIFRLEGDPLQPTLLTRVGAQQATVLHRDTAGRVLVATANPGKLFRLSASRAARGSVESDPKDAQTVATWGVISWRATVPSGSRVEISTRSGNTETPDDTWSPWSSAYTSPEGSPITSPNARYLQWRAVLSGNGEGPSLTSLSAAYLQRNVRPTVRSLTVHPPGIVFQKPYPTGDPDLAGFDNQTTPDRRLATAAGAPQGAASSPTLGRRTYQKGLQTLVWRADDDNGDELVYEVQYRMESESAWKVLERELTEPIYVWDTTTLPDGTYFVKIVASDERANAADLALRGEMVSAALDIDNTPPAIRVGDVSTQGQTTTIAFEVRDDASRIQEVEYSEDGRTWRSVYPADGISDGRTERYELRLSSTIGPRGLTLRATDLLNNIATTSVAGPVSR